MIQFSCRFAFLSTFRLSNRKPKIARILTVYQANAATLTPLSKKDKILIKSQKLVNKGWTKNSINRLLLKFRTVDRRLGSGRRSAHTDENVGTVESLLLTRQDKPESQEKFHARRRDPLIINFADYSQKFCVSSATRKGAFNS